MKTPARLSAAPWRLEVGSQLWVFGARRRCRFDSQGRLKSRDVKIYDVMLLEGSPYRRRAGRDDLPLPPVEKKEKERFLRSIADRRNETAAQRALRVAEYESRPDWQREAWHELPEAFDFRLTGE